MSTPNGKICKICGDNANGYNFNVLSCESCKSFFRRSEKFESFRCRKDGNCVVDQLTRKCCPYCRYAKCLAAGMRRDLINQNKFGQITPRRRSRVKSISESYSSECEEPQVLPNLSLTLSEVQQINEALQATEVAEFYDESQFRIIGEFTNLVAALNLAEAYIKKTIRFCKHFSAFQSLPEDDQLLLLKDFFTELMLIRICYVLVPEKDAFIVIKDEEKRTAVYVKLQILYQAEKQSDLQFCREKSLQCKQEMEGDPTIRDLLLAERLFKPRSDSPYSDFINLQHCKYQNLLQRYLECKYKSTSRAIQKMAQLDQLIQHGLEPARQMMESIYIQSGANQLSAIIKEIFDVI